MQTDPVIGMVMATLMEAKPFIADVPLEKVAEKPFHIFSNKKILLIISGIGKANAAMATFHLCQSYSPKIILNMGAAGAVKEGVTPGDIFHITTIVEYDRPDFKTGRPHIYKPHVLEGFKLAHLATQDKPVIHPDHRKNVSEIAELVDMEAASVAHACSKFNIPATFFKYVTDTPKQHEEEHIIKYIKMFRNPFSAFVMTSVIPMLFKV